MRDWHDPSSVPRRAPRRSFLPALALATWALVVVALSAGMARPAEAKDDDAKSEANGLLAEARQRYDRGEYGGALDRLNQAYAAFPSPLIHFNFGQVYRALLRDVEAIDSFNRFLSEGTAGDQNLRHEAQAYLSELSRKVGSIEVTADTDRAEVTVDGRAAGTTPLRQQLRVPPGSHQIVVQGPGGAIPVVRRIDVAAGETSHVLVRVEGRPLPPAIVVAPPPASEPSPLYKRWWFWAGVGAVVAGVVVTTVALGSSGDDCQHNAGCITFP